MLPITGVSLKPISSAYEMISVRSADMTAPARSTTAWLRHLFVLKIIVFC